jgi:hypothetical protein
VCSEEGGAAKVRITVADAAPGNAAAAASAADSVSSLILFMA